MKLEITIEDIIKGQGADPEKISARKPMLIGIAETARKMGAELIAPHVDMGTFCREDFLNSRRISRDLADRNLEALEEHLEGAVSFTLVVCTIGDGLENLSNQMIAEDFALALALDGMANAAIDRLVENVFNTICDEAAAEGLGASLPVSPGNQSWPLEIGQPFIFGMLKPAPTLLTAQSKLFNASEKISFVRCWRWTTNEASWKNLRQLQFNGNVPISNSKDFLGIDQLPR